MTEEEKENILKELKKGSIRDAIRIIIGICILIVAILFLHKEFKNINISNQLKSTIVNFVENCKNSVETYTVSCEISDKYVSSHLVLDVPMGALTNRLQYQKETDYVVVLEYEEKLYEIYVGENTYNKITIGNRHMCEVTSRKDIFTQECSYEFTLLEE